MESDLKALEFDIVRGLLAQFTFSPYGADAVRELSPAPSLPVARRMQDSVTAARRIVDEMRAPKLSALPDIRAALRQAAQKGAALSAQALLNINLVLNGAKTLQALCACYPGLYSLPEHLTNPQTLDDLLVRTISPAGRLKSDASAELISLHEQFGELKKEVEEKLYARMHMPDIREAFDERHKLVWQGARALFAIKQTYMEHIKGVRRGTAGAGRDVLMEPMEVVALNNRLEALAGQIEAQNQIVLRGITDVVRLHTGELSQLLDALTWIDLALAAGKLSAAMNAAAPRLVEAPIVELRGAYHPQLLLQFRDGHIRQLKPLDISLGKEHRLLLVTGPNTGGKTVVLKTVGLMVTMAHCGLHLPSEGECIIGDFEKIIVDVGDKQSLYHHLSTYAGHVEVLKRLLQEANEKTLVLMDELGTGTDPEEGAALAMAVLDELAARRVHGIVTTHLPPLKSFALEHPYLSNASMRFDYASLVPTYELDCGQSGASLGLIIAEKNGLNKELIEKARLHLARIARPAN